MAIRAETASELIKQLNETDETEDLEAKAVSGLDVGKSVFETICALCNEPQLGGGTILLGVDKEEALFPFYSPTGVSDPDKISSDVASFCASSFNLPVRVNIRPEKVGEATIVRIDVPEQPANLKPVYFRSKNLPSGAYRRMGPTDVRCTDEDLQAFFQGKANEPFDKRIVHDARWDDIDPAAIASYRRARAEANPEAEELNWSDEDMLYALGAITRLNDSIQITYTGLITFGKPQALRRLAPTHRVDYLRVPGKQWVQNPEQSLDSIEIRGPVVSIIGRIIAAITDDLPKTLVIEDGLSGQRTETPVVPFRVIREAVVNSLMHRSYEVFQPIQIVRYANRLEIRNPGHSLKSQERFDEPGSEIRNPTIAEILHETRFAENKGSGIRVMKEKMRQHGLASPTFESDREARQFTATFLFHHFLNESDWEWLSRFAKLQLSEDQMRALIFVREVGAIDNYALRAQTQLDTLAASRSLKALVQLQLLQMRGSGSKTHYVAGSRFQELTNDGSNVIPDKAAKLDGPLSSIQDKTAILDASALTIQDMPPGSENTDDDLPEDMPQRLRVLVRTMQMNKRAVPEEMRKTIARLCDWKPLSLEEIAGFLDKAPVYISQRFISPMVSEGSINYLYPAMPQHPNQKYQSPRLSEVR